MDFENFINEILTDVNNNNNACLNKINNNKILIEAHLGKYGDSAKINDFIDKLTNIILNNKKSNLRLIEKILKHSSFENVLNEFKNSRILVEACKEGENKKVIKWLLKLKMNNYVRDGEGRTALMLASKNPKLKFVAKNIIKQKDGSIDLLDNNGNTALFYAAHNPKLLKTFLRHPNVNNDHVNHDEDTILIYCCRMNLIKSVSMVMTETDININAINKEGRNAAMYAVENGMYKILYHFISRKFNAKYVNEKNGKKENLYTILINEIYYPKEHFEIPYYLQRYLATFKKVVRLGCDPNMPIDEDGNTPLFFFAMIRDVFCVHYIIALDDVHKNLDYNTVNKHGDDIVSLCLSLNNDYLMDLIFSRMKRQEREFKFKRIDDNNNTILMHYAINNNLKMLINVLNYDESLLNQVNDKHENALIVAAKLGHGRIVRCLLEYNLGKNRRTENESAMINQKDYLGNTALFYAVDIKNIFIINELASYKASPNIKNNRGKSAYDLAVNYQEIGDKTIINALMHPTRMKRAPKSKTVVENDEIGFFPALLTYFNPVNYINYIRKKKNSNNEVVLPSTDIEFMKYKGITELSLDVYSKKRYSPLPNPDVVGVIDWCVFNGRNHNTNYKKIVGIPRQHLVAWVLIQSLSIILGIILNAVFL